MSVLRVLTAPFASQQAVCAAAMGLALLAGGCASQQSTQTESLAQSAGMASQPAERDPSDTLAEDAKEPWSPHYGWQPRSRDFAPSYAPIPVDRVSATTRYATMDPDAVIRHAVAAHEMRRQ